MNIDACREESGVNEGGKFLRSGFDGGKVVCHIEENVLFLFRDVIAVDFIAKERMLAGADENACVILLEGGVAANSELVGDAVSNECLHSCFPERGAVEICKRGRSVVFVFVLGFVFGFVLVIVHMCEAAKDDNGVAVTCFKRVVVGGIVVAGAKDRESGLCGKAGTVANVFVADEAVVFCVDE